MAIRLHSGALKRILHAYVCVGCRVHLYAFVRIRVHLCISRLCASLCICARAYARIATHLSTFARINVHHTHAHLIVTHCNAYTYIFAWNV